MKLEYLYKFERIINVCYSRLLGMLYDVTWYDTGLNYIHYNDMSKFSDMIFNRLIKN